MTKTYIVDVEYKQYWTLDIEASSVDAAIAQAYAQTRHLRGDRLVRSVSDDEGELIWEREDE